MDDGRSTNRVAWHWRLLAVALMAVATPVRAADFPCVPLTRQTKATVVFQRDVPISFESLDEKLGPPSGPRAADYDPDEHHDFWALAVRLLL